MAAFSSAVWPRLALVLIVTVMPSCGRKLARNMHGLNVSAAAPRRESPSEGQGRAAQRRGQTATDHVLNRLDKRREATPHTGGLPSRPGSMMGSGAPQSSGTGGFTTVVITTTPGRGTPQPSLARDPEGLGEPTESGQSGEGWRIAGVSLVAAVLIAGVLWGSRPLRRSV